MEMLSMYLGWLTGRRVAGQRKKRIEIEPVHNGILPIGGTYYIGVTSNTIGDYTGATTTLTAGDPFPETVSDGDVYLYGDYEYRYNKNQSLTGNRTWFSYAINGWGVAVIDTTKATYGDIIDSICENPIVSVDYLFSGCSNLTICPEIPAGVYRTCSTFEDCDSLLDIVVPGHIDNIYSMFLSCDNLKTAIVSEGVTSLSSTFKWCYALESVSLPKSLERIGSNTFTKCVLLQEVDIPDGVSEIGSSAFYQCSALKSVTIPDSVQTFGEQAFYGCDALESIIIPDGVTVIPYKMLIGCNNLRTVVLPDSVTSILDYAFEYSGIESINLPNGLSIIETNAFNHCESLTEITIPAKVTNIGDGAFGNCSSLTTVTMLPESPPVLDKNGSDWSTFDNCPLLTQIIVPAGSGEAYKAATGWTKYANLIVEKEVM